MPLELIAVLVALGLVVAVAALVAWWRSRRWARRANAQRPRSTLGRLVDDSIAMWALRGLAARLRRGNAGSSDPADRLAVHLRDAGASKRAGEPFLLATRRWPASRPWMAPPTGAALRDASATSMLPDTRDLAAGRSGRTMNVGMIGDTPGGTDAPRARVDVGPRLRLWRDSSIVLLLACIVLIAGFALSPVAFQGGVASATGTPGTSARLTASGGPFEPTVGAGAGAGVSPPPTPGPTMTATVGVSVPADRFAPVATAPVQSLPAQTLATTTALVRIAWSATDVGTGVARYQLQVSRNGGSYVSLPLASSLARSTIRPMAIGSTFRFRVRAIDRAGNVGSWTYGPSFRVLRYEEGSASFDSSWSLLSSSLYSDGHERRTSTTNAEATMTFSGRSIGWVTTRGPVRGSVQVYLDGALVATVSVGSPTVAYRSLIWSSAFPRGVHTLRLVSAGPTGRFAGVDAFVVLR